MITLRSKSLGARGIFFFSSSLLVILSVITAMNIFHEKRSMEDLADKHIKEFGGLVLTAMRYPMLMGDQDVIQKQFDGYKSLPGVVVVHLTDKQGIIRRSTDKDLIGKKPEVTHLEDALQGKEFYGIAKRKRSGEIVVNEMYPILNEKPCYGCHGSQDKVLGVVRLALDWKATLQTINLSRNWNIILSLIGLLAMSFVIGVFFLKAVVRPIKEVEKGIEDVSKGNLDLQLAVVTKDEIGGLTKSFNQMTRDFKRLVDKEHEKTEEVALLNQSLAEEVKERMLAAEELRRARQGLMEIIEFIPDAVAVIDKDMRVIAWNKAMEEMTGVRKQDIIGKGDYEYAIPFYGVRRPLLINLVNAPFELVEEKYPDLIREGNRFVAEVFASNLYHGKGAYVAAVAAPLFDEKGDIIGAIETVRDITERKQAGEKVQVALNEAVQSREVLTSMLEDNNQIREELEERLEELKRTQDMLIHSEKLASLGRIVSEVAHEVNNPLMIISGNAQLSLMSESLSAEEKNSLQIIRDECQRAKGIIQRLLRFSRPSKGDVKEIDINRSIETIVVMLENQFKLENIEIKRDYHKDLPLLVLDEQQMQEVFMNLINNAKEAISGSGTIAITTSLQGDFVRIDFKDNGSGISEEVRQKLFEPFFTTKEKGTGLGLAVCFGIVKAHHGELRLESELNKGTTAIVLLPRVRDKTSKVV